MFGVQNDNFSYKWNRAMHDEILAQFGWNLQPMASDEIKSASPIHSTMCQNTWTLIFLLSDCRKTQNRVIHFYRSKEILKIIATQETTLYEVFRKNKQNASLSLRSRISSRSDFITAGGFLPQSADLVEKALAFASAFFRLPKLGERV